MKVQLRIEKNLFKIIDKIDRNKDFMTSETRIKYDERKLVLE